MSATYDEPYHLAIGAYYWKLGDPRMAQSFLPGVLGALAGGLQVPEVPPDVWRLPDMNALGGYALYGEGRDAAQLLGRARLSSCCQGVLVGLLVLAWSTRLWGRAGGLLSLTAFCFCPNMVAFGSLVTTEMPVTLGFLLSLATLELLRHEPRPRWAAGHGVALAYALLCKASALLCLPLGVAVLARRPSRRLGLALLGAWSLAYLLIWAFFGFRFEKWTEPRPELYMPQKLALSGAWGKVGRPLWEHKLAPEPLLAGWTDNLAALNRVGFLNGSWSRGGRWFFFPTLFTMKLPAGLLVLVLASLPGWRRAPLLALALVTYWALALSQELNIGFRHVVPTLPWLYILAGSVVRWRLLALVAALALALESLASAPQELAFVNFLWGGPTSGYRRITDSSLDWGQDLGRSAAWLGKNPAQPCYFAYFGSAWPDYYGVQATMLPTPGPLRGGTYLISATALQLPYLSETLWAGPWTPALEEKYRREHDPAERGRLRFARLCSVLRDREPDDRIGWTILVYRLTDREVQDL